jgi:hypothetical protein
MIFLITFIILFLLLFLTLTSLHYWNDLLSEKTTVTRLELLDPTVLIGFALNKIVPSQNTAASVVSFLISFVFAFFLLWLGGLVAPDRSDSPDFAGNEIANYFFQSNLILLLLHFSWNYFRDLTIDKKNTFAGKLAETETAFLSGTGLTLSAAGLASWGVYHEMYFLAVFGNAVFAMGFLHYMLLRQDHKKSLKESDSVHYDHSENDDEYENIVGLDDLDFPDDSDSLSR